MSSNKNQHYVPRVHFRPFTLKQEGRAINVFNLDRLEAIPNAPAKNQCSGDYFYGQDARLEDAINFIESPYGRVVRHLMTGGAIDAAVTAVLRRFIYLQHLRTEAASRKATEMAFALSDVPGSDLPRPSSRDAAKEAVQSAMLHFGRTMRIVDDLKLCIVRARNSGPFVTSDDPAVLTNRLHLQRLQRTGRSFGAHSAGAIYLMPLSPSLLALLYDGAVYSADARSGWVDVDDAAATALNDHQYLNCVANIYFADWSDRESVAAAARSAAPRRPESRFSVVHAVRSGTTETHEHYVVRPNVDLRDGEKVLVHIAANYPVPAGWPSFLRFRANPTAWSNSSGTGLTRRACLDEGFISGTGYRRGRL